MTATCPVLPPAVDRPFSQGFPRYEHEFNEKKMTAAAYLCVHVKLFFEKRT